MSASDIGNHLACRHLTTLDMAAARGELQPPQWRDPRLEILHQRGLEHESEYLEHLRGQGLTVTTSAGTDGLAAVEATAAAMRRGADVIVQATLAHRDWYGRADILRRVPAASALGDWSYEVVDTKLARETRAGTILQLCLYSELVGAIQRCLPERMHVVTPGTDFARETYMVREFLAYYRFIRNRLADVVAAAADSVPSTYPDPVPHCDICRWWSFCDSRRRADDHVSLVAGVSTLQRSELSTWGVATLTEVAQLPVPLKHRPRRGSAEGYVRVREQARVQLEGRRRQVPYYELLPRQPELGFARLPAPSAGDIFFDVEGDPFVSTGGLEYLLGWVVRGPAGGLDYRMRWAADSAAERAAFEAFIDEVLQRWERYPDLHVYHFAPYEPGAIKRLMGRYATREDDVDRILREELFVDLHSIARQSLRAAVERYSIKDLEQFYRFTRATELRDASKNLRVLEHALELGRAEAVPEAVWAVVEAYNRDDCMSIVHLRDWLEGIRSSLLAAGEAVSRPAPADRVPSGSVDEQRQRVLALMERLLRGVPDEREERSEEEHARWLLAHLLDWHRREEKAPWWDFFRLAALGDAELMEEDLALAGLEHVCAAGGTKRAPVHRYRFPPQETRMRTGDPLHVTGGDPVGTVHDLDQGLRTIDIKKRMDSVDLHPVAVFSHTVVAAKEQAGALIRLGEWVAGHGVDAPGTYRAARDLLLGRIPRLRRPATVGTPIQPPGEAAVATARRVARELDGGVLGIQGPPGAGKTYTGARMISELVRAGKKVGVTAISHKVIRNLLEAAVDAAEEEAIELRCLQKVSGKATKDTGQPILETTTNKEVGAALDSGRVHVAGGTGWLWAREELFEAIDVLFVDEAGQMSLANVLAVAQAARNIVLLGDPQQLDQPLRGSHPDGTEVSAFQHLLAGNRTISEEQGLFLAETWRLHPSICALTSEVFYEGRLESRTDLAGQAVTGATRFAGAGLWFAPVHHHGNQNTSAEEVERVAGLHAALLSSNLIWTDREGRTARLAEQDVLIVAPYNAHVGALGERLPNARVGTVDKFQGQEAPVVIYTMATSSPEEAPHGMEFLFSLNRLNVATSRARCVCILVANPLLFEPECRTPRQIQLANAFCRYLELATVI